MKMKFISNEELEELIKSGKAKKIHLSTIDRILRPRGPLQKESIGLTIFEKLISNYFHWNNSEYSDTPEVDELLKCLKKNLDEEVSASWSEALRLINTCKTEEEIWEKYWKRRDDERK